jgi:hypothetical protein
MLQAGVSAAVQTSNQETQNHKSRIFKCSALTPHQGLALLFNHLNDNLFLEQGLM